VEKTIISLGELSGAEIRGLVKAAVEIKKNPTGFSRALSGKTLFLLFQKTSTRTRLAFELGMKKLGGFTVEMDWAKTNFSISPLRHEARYVGTMVDCVLARLLRNEDVLEFAARAEVPFINGCCNLFHPTQALADLMTVYEVAGGFDASVAYVGIQNNVANSLFYACTKAGVKLTFVTPLKDELPERFEDEMKNAPGFSETLDLEEAVSRSGFVYTDTWINMEVYGDPAKKKENEAKTGAMMRYQVNRKLVEGRDVYVLHDMPVHPGLEIDEYAVTCERSLIFRQAENRMYAGQALLLALLDAGGGPGRQETRKNAQKA
jgi:ornithine carbamoyltransferase